MLPFYEFKKQVKLLEEEMESEIDNDLPETYIFTDGIMDIEKYYYSKVRILWVLKEPYAHADGTIDDYWHIKDTLAKLNGIKNIRMAYVSWAILNNISDWNKIPHTSDGREVLLNALKSTGIINIKKAPGKSESLDKDISCAYDKNKDILHKQLENYNPNIVIFGNTIQYFSEYLKFDEYSKNNYHIYDNTLYIQSKHPSNIMNQDKQDEWGNNILNAVKNWSSKKI